MNQPLRYFIYARKSSEGSDRQILSIDGQIGQLQKLVVRESLVVVGVYTESKSAHIPNNRPVFNNMIKQIHKGVANGIIVWHTNRISRNPKESGEIQQMLQDGKIVSIITPYRQFKSDDNALLFSIETSEANQYSRDLSVNVKRGLRQKYEMGYPPGIAKLGYQNTKSAIRGANKIIVDLKRWHIVRKGFDLMLTRAYTVNEVLDILTNKYGLRTRFAKVRGGRPLSLSGLYRMLTDPFYYGVFYRNGILYRGAYKPMITPMEYDYIQEILGRKGKPRNQKHEFAFTGLIKCGSCGSSITASKKRKLIKSTGEIKSFTYYHCTHRKKGASDCSEKTWIPEHQIEQQIIDELQGYEIDKECVEWTMIVANNNYQNEITKFETLVNSRNELENRIQRELNNLIDLRISNGISEEVYFQKKAEKEELLIRVQAKSKNLEELCHNWIKEIEDRLNFVVNIVARFKNSDSNVRKEICHDFGWNWIVKDKKLFIDKEKWLEPIKKYKNSFEGILMRLEPKNTLVEKGENPFIDHLVPLVRGLVEEVRTGLHSNIHFNKP